MKTITQSEFLEFFPNRLFQYFHDSTKGKDAPISRVHIPEKFRVSTGYGHFFSVNGYGNTKNPHGAHTLRWKGNIVNLNAFFVDIDGLTNKETADGKQGIKKELRLKEFLLEKVESKGLPFPTFIVETKNGAHIYWVFTDPVPVSAGNEEVIKKYEEKLKDIRYLLGGDPEAAEASRVLRIPGTIHLKDPAHPFETRIIYANTDNTYSAKEVSGMVAPRPEEDRKTEKSDWGKIASGVSEGNRNANATKYIGKLLRGLKPEEFESFAWQTVVSWNEKNSPPLSKEELRTTFESIASREVAKKKKPKVQTEPILPAQAGEKQTFVEFLTTEDKKGNEIIVPCQENVTRALRSFNCIRYDTFRAKYEIHKNGSWEVRDDHHDVWLYSRMANRFPFLSSRSMNNIKEAVTLIGFENAYDSAQEKLKSLVWDKTPRLDTWLHHTYGVEDSEYHAKVGANWLKGMAKRIMQPGCKFDFAIILHGAQGIRKSMSLLILAGEENHIEFTKLAEREFEQNIQGKTLVEFSEAAVFYKSDQETLKSILTRQKDSYRPPYARSTRDFPRRCVFAVTANADEVLKDDTGNRRWWPIFCGKNTADTDWLSENRDQLFAEARDRVMVLKETVWEVPEEALLLNQEAVRMREQDEDIISDWFKKLSEQEKANGVTIRDAFVTVYAPVNRDGIPIPKENVPISKRSEMSIARIFRTIGLGKKRVQVNKEQKTRWFEKDVMEGMEITILTKEEQEAEELRKLF